MSRASDKRQHSLHGILLRMMLVSGSAMILFLLALSVYWIRAYQETLRNGWRESLAACAGRLEDELAAANSFLFDIYYYDANARALETAEKLDAYPYAYELEERLKTIQMLNRQSGGYVFYFNNTESRRYYFETDSLTNSEVEAVKELTKSLILAADGSRAWHYVDLQGRAFALSVYRRGGFALSRVICIEPILEELRQELSDEQAEVFLINGGLVLGDAERAAAYEPFLAVNDRTEGGRYVLKQRVAGSTLQIGLCIPMRIWTYMNIQQLGLLALSVFVIAVFIVTFLRFRRELFRPLEQLTADMKRIGSGDWSSGIHSASVFTEIEQVIDTTDKMLAEIEKQKLLAYEKTIQEQRARLQYLSLQLNPHFYLNGLKTLNVLAMNGENERIQDIIIRLSEYLRYLLAMERETVTLAEEMRFVENYASLRKDMTDRPLRLVWHVGEGLESCLVPKLCIQTFVENSFKYAKLGEMVNELVVTISVNRLPVGDEQLLEIVVHDNGAGYAPELLDVLNNPSEESTATVGISNLKRRCDILYEGKTQYAFYNDGGAVSDIFYPMTAEPGKEGDESSDRG